MQIVGVAGDRQRLDPAGLDGEGVRHRGLGKRKALFALIVDMEVMSSPT